MAVDRLTQRWIRNASDERAVANGCWFEEAAGQYVVDWIAKYCRLYEGDYAGQPMELCDWQYEATMRLFGWMRHSERWDRAIRRFRQASIWVPKKNKKSPTLAAWGLYLLCGDGEPGQKVFFAAKDGNQARDIAGKHAYEMLMQSEDLRADCNVNLTLMRITHEPTRSLMQPLSSSNSRHKQAKEGINGSVLIDETHVVDREFIARIKRAGISRSEPLMIEVSTAGKDSDCYGKDRFDYGQAVATGAEENDSLLFLAYHAPPDLKDIDLDADPCKWGRMANPAWGHTIDETEFLGDYRESKVSRRELADFKTYRLNVWQNSDSPWLEVERWTAGRREFSAADMEGRRCWAALDLSSVRDFSALTLAFDEGNERVRMLWWYWLPEETARNVRHQIPIDEWRSDPRCNLILTPGSRIDYAYISATFRELSERFEVMAMYYDDWNAEKTTQELEEGRRDRDGRLIEPGTGVPRVNFGQGLKTMNEPTKQFEARVIDGKIEHNGDPLTAWMIRNATIKPDANGNYKPMKPGKDSLKKIDGVITGVMALAGLMNDTGDEVLTEVGVWVMGDDGDDGDDVGGEADDAD